MYLKKFPGTNN